MSSTSPKILPPIFSSEQEQNKAECAAIWYAYAGDAEKTGDIQGAHMGFMCAWREQPQELRYFQTLVNYLVRHEHIDQLFKVYEMGIQLFREHVPTLVNYSNLLNQYGRYQNAHEVAELALIVDSHCLPAWGNLGNALRGLGKSQQAESCFRKILKEEPNNPVATFNLGCLELQQSLNLKGLEHYESRLELPGYERLSSRNMSVRWKGETLTGKSILVYAEQGLGDTFMFSKLIPMLIEKGPKRIVFEVQRPVAWFFDQLAIDSEIVEIIPRKSLEDRIELQTDFQIPLLSLPRFFHDNLHSIGELDLSSDSMSLDAPRADELLRGVNGSEKLRVGLCWQGNPHAAIDCGRSIDLEEFLPLLKQTNHEFVSLQGKDGLDQIHRVSREFRNFHHLDGLDQQSRPFEETICLMKGLDLVITTDTSIAHLAGLLQKPTWLFLQKHPEWRWGVEGDSTPWYSSVKLFRQHQNGDWNGVFQYAVAQLKKLT